MSGLSAERRREIQRMRSRASAPPPVPMELYFAAVSARDPNYYDSQRAIKVGRPRLKAIAQTEAIFLVMRDRCWRTVPELTALLQAQDPGRKFIDTSVSADLRNLRKDKFGSYTVEARRRRAVVGLWEYRLMEPQS